MVYLVLMVDGNGVLNVAGLDLIKGWQGPDTIGNANFVPGSRVAVFKHATTYTALIVDKNGVLNFAYLLPAGC
jgi:hypothetical protein